MPTVVIIHAADDALPARALAEKLRPARLQVVLEKQPGDELRSAIKSAQVTIALWSPRSVAQPALLDDTNFARSKSKLVHACMQSAPVPQQFAGDKAVNLTGWRGEDDFAGWRDLAKLVTEKAGVQPLPPPAPRPPSGFFQPGRSAAAGQPGANVVPLQPVQQQRPQQPAPRPAAQTAPAPQPAARQPRPAAAAPPAKGGSGGGGRGMLIGAAAVVIAGLGGGGYWYWSQSQAARSTEAAWEAVERNDAGALRAFIAGAPGEFRDDAETALAELEERTLEAASDADTVEALEGFLAEFPNSEHRLAVSGRIAELRSALPADAADAAVEPAPAEAVPAPAPDPAPAPSSEPGPAPITPPSEPEPEGAPTN